MKNKKIPLRLCVVTRERLPKQELIRIVRTPDGNVLVDTTSKMNGKGVYIKKDITVLEKLKKGNILKRSLEVEIPDSIYLDLENIINSK